MKEVTSQLFSWMALFRRTSDKRSHTPYHTPTHWLKSGLCNQAQLESSLFQKWAPKIGESNNHLHRKAWEYYFIIQALFERGMLNSGMKGLGFAVGREPLAAYFASLECEILATDLARDNKDAAVWMKTNQHASSIDYLNDRGLCQPERFRSLVRFRSVDMRDLPDDLSSVDFIWSACSLEHLGTILLGEKFIEDSIALLKPGGVAVYTTEYNLSSNLWTKTVGPTVIFRKRDIELLEQRLLRQGFEIEVDFSEGNLWADQVIDEPPYSENPHLRLRLHGQVVTSIGLIIRRPKTQVS